MTQLQTGPHEMTIYVGGVYASPAPMTVKTLLGSCIAACLYDPIARVGGMNHFMLPIASGSKEDADSTRFGAYAMDCLVGELMMHCKADRRRLVAKVFGAAHVVGMKESDQGVPQKNIRFIRQYLEDEGFPLMSEDLGGYQPRIVLFDTDTGRARIKRLGGLPAQKHVLATEAQSRGDAAKFGDVTLF